ncbi:DMT family transporter [Gilvimarinus sp. DA14]|uniref:DMT family transporter n=1 Tax=Gilvimarinus sp. DA14 TaxID=2956798 RepID=UPI0020B719A0|nr:DMT family transporter [Gilvimarinus sp. DA14]UTF60594.1 DMT family transporter [Gilvimarinus sp. DA14]
MISYSPFANRLGLVLLTMLAFAGNSLLCRLALATQAIDAVSFTLVRIISGALMLWLLVSLRRRPSSQAPPTPASWAALSLFTYALLFSLAYVSLGAAEGALILFAAVQLTLLGYALWRGVKVSSTELLGALLAFAGLAGLLLPAAARPSVLGFVLMAGAGLAWGVFTLLGRRGGLALQLTAHSFFRAAVLCVILLPFVLLDSQWSWYGFALAVFSGAGASALGYALWYAVLPSLSVAQAAAVQLSVPVWAALGGILWLGESLSLQFIIASLVILGGIALTLIKR